MDITTVYAQHLFRRNMRDNTIKNYLSDVRQFLKWKELSAPNASITDDLIDQYLKGSSFTKSVFTTRRKQASLKKFAQWINNQSASSNLDTIISKQSRRVYSIVISLILLLLPFAVSTSSINTLSNSQHLDIVDDHSSDMESSVTETKLTMERPIDLTVEGVQIAVSGYEIQNPIHEPTDVLLSLQGNNEREVDKVDTLSPTGGTSKIESGKTYSVILDESINQNTLVTVTPTAPTYGQTLFVKSLGDGFAVIAIEQPLESDIPFNWIAIK